MIDQTSQQSDVMQGLTLPDRSQGGNEDEAIAAMTTKAIQNAFLMGWSIQELKSRVLLWALGLPSTVSISSPPQESVPATNSSASPPTQPVGEIDRLLQSLVPPAHEPLAQQAADEQIRKMAHSDEWRASFIRIAVIHDQCFPASTTLNTPYDPSPDKQPDQSFPYLYPSMDPNYALVGINGSETLGVSDLDDESHLENFTLYDVGRRTLNCLALLSTRPEESLIPNVILSYQTLIVEALFSHLSSSDNNGQGALQNVAAISSAVQGSLEQEAVAILQEYITEALASPAPETVSLAIKIFSFLIVRFLDSWDGYVSENYYVGGLIKNDSLELIAYEAGRSLASLVWGVSLVTMLAENASAGEADQTHLLNQLCTIWLRAFDAAPINLLARQVSTLGPFLDDAFYVLKKVQRPEDRAKPGPDVPGRAIHAITYSLVYWQRAIQWICQPSSNGGASDTKMTVELSRKLRQTLIDQAGIWHSLILGWQTLRSFASDGVTRKIMSTLMNRIEDTVEKNVQETSESVFKRFRVPIIVGGSVFLVFIVGAIILLALTKQLEGLLAIIGLVVGSGITAVSTFLSRAGSFVSGEERTVGTMASNSVGGGQLSGLLSLAGGEVAAVFQSAYQQIKLEFDDLNHYTAITYPLVDLFIQNSEPLWNDIKDSYGFLTSVVWTSEDQEEELEQISRAALGPLGVWAGSFKQQVVKQVIPPHP